jgi:hypothetical protein
VRIVRLTLTGPPGIVPNQADAEVIHDVLWAHAVPGTGIAHITTTALQRKIDVAIFLDSDVDDPEQRVAALLSSVSRESSILRLWVRDDNWQGER